MDAMGDETVSTFDKLRAQIRRRHVNETALIEGPLVYLDDKGIQSDAREFARHLPDVDYDEILRAARLAKNGRAYEDIAYGRRAAPPADPVRLTEPEKEGLRAERNKAYTRGMLPVLATVGTAAFLQGHVQSSINAASLYAYQLGVPWMDPDKSDGLCFYQPWILGAMNASPFLFAAVIGAPLALPLNYWIGRRGAIAVAAVTILVSSLASAFVSTWQALFAVRVLNGIGMGIKAISAPILASETAVGYWRGSSTLMWQLWVAFGIMLGHVINLILAACTQALDVQNSYKSVYLPRERLVLQLILGAPLVPAIILLAVLSYCMESPRFHMQPDTPNYNPGRAYDILSAVRPTKLQALRDIYLIHRSVELELELEESPVHPAAHHEVGLTYASYVYSALSHTTRQYGHLFKTPRLRNAVWSTCVLALAQQLCGINIFAFYSNYFFTQAASGNQTCPGMDPGDPNSPGHQSPILALVYSFGFGAVNFIFCLPAIRTVDTFGRRSWLLATLPLMSLFLAAGALSLNFLSNDNANKLGIVALWIFLFAAAYSPGLGPIPFISASESFPLSQREAGCSLAISINMLFSGLLTIFFPKISEGLRGTQFNGVGAGALGLFSGFNIVALVLIFLLNEETRGMSLEDLSAIYAVPKSAHIEYQLKRYLPYLFRRYVLFQREVQVEDFYTVVAERLGENDETPSTMPPLSAMDSNYELGPMPMRAHWDERPGMADPNHV